MSPSGSAPGPGGCSNEMLRVCLDDVETLGLLFFSAAMTALQKKDGGVRGIATGTSFRRLVAKTLARQFGAAVEATCAPFQFALSPRAGVDCVGHAGRVATDQNTEATVLSIDGVGAYDHVLRSLMMSKLRDTPSLQGLLPVVRAVYSRPSCYKWRDSSGTRELSEHAGIQLNEGKTRVWNRAGVRPPHMEVLGPEVWNEEGVKILGTPIGSDRFIEAVTEERLTEERRLWDALAWVPDLQSAWQMLLQCAGPRCHHFLRTVPPDQSARYAVGHDLGMRRAMESVLGSLPGTKRQKECAHELATLPLRLGGLGLRSARRMAPAAFWVSWADALPMLSTFGRRDQSSRPQRVCGMS